MLSELSSASIVILIAGALCLSAIVISVVITKFKGIPAENSKYECGFVNTDQVQFFDSRMLLIPFFIVMESTLLWLLFYILTSVFLGVSVQHMCFYFFLIIFVVCIIYTENLYNK